MFDRLLYNPKPTKHSAYMILIKINSQFENWLHPYVVCTTFKITISFPYESWY